MTEPSTAVVITCCCDQGALAVIQCNPQLTSGAAGGAIVVGGLCDTDVAALRHLWKVARVELTARSVAPVHSSSSSKTLSKSIQFQYPAFAKRVALLGIDTRYRVDKRWTRGTDRGSSDRGKCVGGALLARGLTLL